MNTGRQVLRYSIPGSVFLLFSGTFAIVSQLVQLLVPRLADKNSEHPSAAREILAGLPPISAELVVAGIAASVPIGFLLYQLYYTAIVVVPVVRADHAGRALEELWREGALTWFSEAAGWQLESTADLVRRWPATGKFGLMLLNGRADREPRQGDERHGDDRVQPPQNRTRRRGLGREYSHRVENNLHGLKALIDVHGETRAGRALKAEYTGLSDIYHALGASRMAVFFSATAYLLHLLLSWILGRDGVEALVAATLCALISGGAVLVLSFARGQTWNTLSAVVTMTLRVLVDAGGKPRGGVGGGAGAAQPGDRARPEDT
jgi:hypothetical protein